MLRRAHVSILLSILALLALPASARAQFGVGIRMASMSGLETANGTESPERWFVGGQIRLRGSRAALELSLDQHTTTSPELQLETRRRPFQTSLLLFMAKGAIAPYLMGGVGWYSTNVKSTAPGATDAAVSTRDFGYHFGLGGEFRFGKHVAAHLDYRWVHVNNETLSGNEINIPGVGTILDKLGIKTNSSMWTTGATFYF
jgi:opacity protein-like surface antigen